MMRTMLQCCVTALVTLLLSAPLPALGAGADGRSAIRRFAEQQAGDRAGAAMLVGRATVGPAARLELPASLDLGGQACKWKLELAEGSATASLSGGKVSEEGPAMPALAALATLACPWLAIRALPADEADAVIGKQLTALGAAASTSSLARADRRVAVVIGARAGDRSRPQLWLDQETGRPVRVLGKVASQLWEARLLEPASIATGRRAPRVVEIWRGAERKLQIRLMTPQAEAVRDGTPVSPNDADDPD